ncbi:MAG: hypothetical protein ABEJ95_06070 [Candidatus Nanohalobium sp.]
MPRFVCPFCDDVIKAGEGAEVCGDALDHVVERHGKENMSEEYILENIRSN